MARAMVKHNFGKKIDAEGLYSSDLVQIAHFEIENAPLAAVAAVHAAYTLDAVDPKVVTTNITNPTVARNLTVTGNQAGVAGNVVIAGTNMADEAITETIVAADAATVVGNKAFKTVTSITFPPLVGAGDTISVGTGAKLGIPYKLFFTGNIFQCYMAGAVEAIAASTASSTAVDGNTFTTTTALDGVKDIHLYILVE